MRKYQILDVIDQKFKGKAYDNQGHQCFYLTSCGKECAIGMFIPDGHEAKKDMFEDGIRPLLKEYPELAEHMPSKNIDFLVAFQNNHDNIPDDWNVDMQKTHLMDWIEKNYDSYNHDKLGIFE